MLSSGAPPQDQTVKLEDSVMAEAAVQNGRAVSVRVLSGRG